MAALVFCIMLIWFGEVLHQTYLTNKMIKKMDKEIEINNLKLYVYFERRCNSYDKNNIRDRDMHQYK